MSRTRVIWLSIAGALVCAALVWSVSLIARSLSPSAAPAPLAVTTAAQSSSTQPKIAWSTNHIEVILSPGESTSRDLTFTSSLSFQNAVLEPVPAIAPFVTITPSTFSSVPPNTPQAVHVAFAIPAGTTLGTYDGTIHLRIGTQTLPQTFKVTIAYVRAPIVLPMPVVTPPFFVATESTPVTVSMLLPTFGVIPSHLVLERVDNVGSPIALLGALHDDGADGDEWADENVFTVKQLFSESIPGQILLRVSATFVGLSQRFYSPTIILVADPFTDPQEVLTQLAARLRDGNISGALEIISTSSRDEEHLKSLDQARLMRLADFVSYARLKEQRGTVRIYEGLWIDSSGRSRTLELIEWSQRLSKEFTEREAVEALIANS